MSITATQKAELARHIELKKTEEAAKEHLKALMAMFNVMGTDHQQAIKKAC